MCLAELQLLTVLVKDKIKNAFKWPRLIFIWMAFAVQQWFMAQMSIHYWNKDDQYLDTTSDTRFVIKKVPQNQIWKWTVGGKILTFHIPSNRHCQCPAVYLTILFQISSKMVQLLETKLLHDHCSNLRHCSAISARQHTGCPPGFLSSWGLCPT